MKKVKRYFNLAFMLCIFMLAGCASTSDETQEPEQQYVDTREYVDARVYVDNSASKRKSYIVLDEEQVIGEIQAGAKCYYELSIPNGKHYIGLTSSAEDLNDYNNVVFDVGEKCNATFIHVEDSIWDTILVSVSEYGLYDFNELDKNNSTTQNEEQTENLADKRETDNLNNSVSNYFDGINLVKTENGNVLYMFDRRENVMDKISQFENQDYIFLQKTKNGYKRTEENGKDTFYYKGEINSKGEPDGIGIVYKSVFYEECEVIACCYYGEFDNGIESGYGCQCNLPDYEQLFKFTHDIFYDYFSDKEYTDESNYTFIVECVNHLNYVEYEGMFKNGKYEGAGNYFDHIYWTLNSVFDDEYEFMDVVYTLACEFKNGKANGYGYSYDDKGECIYEGMYKNGDYE